MRSRYASDFSMSEQQIYKWWWDQTRKRVRPDGSDGEEPDTDMINLISFQDEFGGYSSRLRNSGFKRNKKREEKENKDGDSLEVNLCELLGIDVEAIAIRIAMEGDYGAEEEEQINQNYNQSDIYQR